MSDLNFKLKNSKLNFDNTFCIISNKQTYIEISVLQFVRVLKFKYTFNIYKQFSPKILFEFYFKIFQGHFFTIRFKLHTFQTTHVQQSTFRSYTHTFK